MIKRFKEKIIGTTGSISGVASIMGSWQVCHNICLGIVALLAILGITVIGMPLAFLTKLAIPFWSVAFVLLLITIGIYIKKKCISKNLIMFNSGLIIAGIPFQALQNFQIFFWVIGGVLVAVSVSLFIKGKINKKR